MIPSILTILSISIILVNCAPIDDCDCVYYTQCDSVYFMITQTNSFDGVKWCNQVLNLVCCPDIIKEMTIAEKMCLSYPEIEGFCKKQLFIRDGSPTEPTQFPFMALVKHEESNNKFEAHCGGTLIDPMYVLTGAHCIMDNTNMSVVLGSGEQYFVTSIVHEDYESYYNNHDIALLKLDRKAKFTKFVKPACLSEKNANRNESYFIAGWGGNTNNSDALLYNTVIEVDGNECSGYLGNETTTICARPSKEFGDPCEGDSGGPIFSTYPGRDTCLFGVVGVISKGNMCNVKMSRTRYMHVSFYREWIEKIVWPQN